MGLPLEERWAGHVSKENHTFNIKNLELADELVFTNAYFKTLVSCEKLTFKYCKFKKVTFGNTDGILGLGKLPNLNFIGSDFGDLGIYNSRLTDLKIAANCQIIGSFECIGNNIQQFTLAKSNLGQSTRWESTFIDTLSFSKIETSSKEKRKGTIHKDASLLMHDMRVQKASFTKCKEILGIKISGNSAFGSLEISDPSQLPASAHILNFTTTSEVTLQKLILAKAHLKEISLQGEVQELQASHFQCDVLELKDAAALGRIHIRSGAIRERLRFASVGCIEKIALGQKEVDDQNPTNSLQMGEVSFDHTSITNLEILGVTMDRLSVTEVFLESGMVNDCQVGELAFKLTLRKGSLFQCIKSSITHLNFDEFINQGLIRLIDLKAIANSNPRISLIYSDLQEIQLIKVDLTPKVKFLFFNSKMAGAFVAGTELPRHMEVPYKYRPHNTRKQPDAKKEKENELLAHDQERLIFNQFSKVYLDNKDFARAFQYRALSLEAHRKRIWLKPRKNLKNWADLLILGLNRLTNDYGNSLPRAALSAVCISLSLFVLYLYNLGGAELLYDFPRVRKAFSFYFEFLIPTHRPNFMLGVLEDELPLPANARLIDSLSRLVNSFLIYQFIQAFRKYGRRS
ncbi:MAG TPA: hypothetical protein DCR93_33505 [Cytophagales bacterium]|nr:hypothetical protein [Cytophagales bacterium]